MTSDPSSALTEAVHTLFAEGTFGSLTDRQLVERFATEKTEAAFAALVARHGPMVRNVCEAVLGDSHDAEDAFQASFLILAKRSRSIGNPDLLGRRFSNRLNARPRTIRRFGNLRYSRLGSLRYKAAPALSDKHPGRTASLL